MDTLINKKLLAANSIFRYVRKGHVEDLTTLHGVDAEIIEYVVPDKSKLIGRHAGNLGIPKLAIVGAVVRGQECIIDCDDTLLDKGDKVIILAEPKEIMHIQKLFN